MFGSSGIVWCLSRLKKLVLVVLFVIWWCSVIVIILGCDVVIELDSDCSDG